MEFSSKRLLMKASFFAGEAFGSSRKSPKRLGKLAGKNYSTLMEFYSKRLLMKGLQEVEEACQTTVRVSGVPEKAAAQTTKQLNNKMLRHFLISTVRSARL